LSSNELSPADLKQLYHFRWGIETAFRELKYALSMICFHAKKKELIKQKIYAHLILYNFSMRFILQANLKENSTRSLLH
jgi:IS4 transposase